MSRHFYQRQSALNQLKNIPRCTICKGLSLITNLGREWCGGAVFSRQWLWVNSSASDTNEPSKGNEFLSDELGSVLLLPLLWFSRDNINIKPLLGVYGTYPPSYPWKFVIFEQLLATKINICPWLCPFFL